MAAPTIAIPAKLQKGHKDNGEDAHAIGQRWVSHFVDLAGLTGEKRILDVGCGPGRMAISIGDRFGWTNRYVGFEVERRDVDFCRKHITASHPNFQFFHLDVQHRRYNPQGLLKGNQVRFPVEAGSIDFCLATSVFTHLFSDVCEHYVREAARVLAPGGAFFSSWAILDSHALESIRQGRAGETFPHTLPTGERVAVADDPEKFIAYDDALVRRWFAQAGLTYEFVRGAWPRVPGSNPRTRQDIIIGRRA